MRNFRVTRERGTAFESRPICGLETCNVFVCYCCANFLQKSIVDQKQNAWPRVNEVFHKGHSVWHINMLSPVVY